MKYEDLTKEQLLLEVQKLEIENVKLKNTYHADIASREHFEEELKHEQQFSKSLIDSLPGIFYLYTYPELKLIMYNKNHEALLGYAPGEIIGRHIYDWHIPEAKEKAREAIELVMEKGLNILESPLLNKDGHYIPFLMTGTKFESHGQQYLMGVGIDITERQRAEAALRKSESMLNMVLDNVPQSIFWKDSESRYLGCNRVFSEAAGLADPDDIIGKSDYDLPWTKEESDAYIADDKEVFLNNRPKLHIIETLQQANGSNLWIDTSKIPLIDTDGTPFGVLGVYNDITERKQIQEALLASELRFRTVLENLVNVAVQAYKPDGTVTFWNKTSEEYYGYTQSEMLGKNFLEIFFQDASQREHEFIEMDKILRTGVLPNPEEITMVNKFGKTVSFIANRMLIERSNNELEFFCFDIDITERKIAEAEIISLNEELENRVIERTSELQLTLDKLQESNLELKMLNDQVVDDTKKILLLNDELVSSQEKLKEAIASKDKFFSIIAHDLRNPFVVLLNNSELLEKYYQKMDDVEKMRIILLIKNASANTYSLLENLLQWASSQLGMIEFSPFDINLHDLVRKIIMILKPMADQKQISLNMSIPANAIAFCDVDMIKTVINNLITNSIKFTRTGGDILIGMEYQHELGEHIVFVRDNGIGMNQEILNGVFKIDRKVSRKGTEGEPSTGLGLLICKEFIDNHNGKIWAESTFNTGSTFYFTIPAK